MTQNEQVYNLFQNVICKSMIRHTNANGFDKYIVYNDSGSLFSIGFNKNTKKYGFGRTELMLKEYQKHNLSIEIMPDFPCVYNEVMKRFDIYQSMSGELKSVYDLINRFTGKDGPKR